MANPQNQTTLRLLAAGILLFLAVASLSCRASAIPPTPTITITPSETPSPSPSATPSPTETPTITSSPSSTPTPTRTATLDYAATSAAKSTQFAATAMVDIEDDLEDYGFTLEDGYLAWLSTIPVTLTVDTYGASEFHMVDPELVMSDFVFQTEITWDSTGGLAGCGYTFRSSRSLSRGSFYDFFTIRLSGLPVWYSAYWNEGYREKLLTPDFPAHITIRQKAGSTNRFAVVAQGDKIAFYANGTRLRTVRDKTLKEGRFGYFVNQESGETTCVFANTWVWALK